MASPTQIGLSTFPALASRPGIMRSFALVVATGLLNSLIAAYLFLHLPADRHPSIVSLAVRAVVFVLVGAAVGTAGSWFYWRRPTSPLRDHPILPFALFAAAAAAGWVWVPAVILLSREDSPLTAAVAALAAALLANALRPIVSSHALMMEVEPFALQTPEPQLFAATLSRERLAVHGYVVAICLYVAAWWLHSGWTLDAAMALAACSAFCAWRRLAEPTAPLQKDPQTTRATRRLAVVLPLAALITFFTLVHGIEHRDRLEALAAAEARIDSDEQARAKASAQSSSSDIAGYHSLILWPAPQKKQIVAPLPQPDSLLAPGVTKPLVIKFDGPYLYYQPPNHGPSSNAHQAHGTPLAANIQTNNFMSLVMEAHQPLGTAIPVSRLRAIEVSLLNRENDPGVINVALLLTDSASPGRQVVLDQQPLTSSLPENFSIKATPAAETLRYSMPASPALQRFDGLTVMFFPDAANYNRGAKVAIEQFALIPR